MTQITKRCDIERTPRVMQLEGLFDVPPAEEAVERWEVDLPLGGQEWNVGLIYGPSGCGKTTIASEFWPDLITQGFTDWPENRAVIDGFPAEISIRDITAALSSVGFSSPPHWLRPYRVLSTGQRFRVDVARQIVEAPDVAVVDEFTSTVDRRVAQIGSAAIARAVRTADRRFVAVTCHHDVIEWLQPDWTYRPDEDVFEWRSVQPRPTIELDIEPVHRERWDLYAPHHYLSPDISQASVCYEARLPSGEPVAFCAFHSFPHPKVPGWRCTRIVVLPDYQGIGIGRALLNYVASLYRATGKYVSIVTSHPAFLRSLARSAEWNLRRNLSHGNVNEGSERALNNTVARSRRTAGFEYIGPANREDARAFGVKGV